MNSYGDLTPTKRSSKIFTIFFILIGVALIASALGLIGGFLIERQDTQAQKSSKKKPLESPEKDQTEMNCWERVMFWCNGRSPTAKKLFASVVVFFVVLITGTIGFILTEHLSVLDAVFFCIVTMSTIGYATMMQMKLRDCRDLFLYSMLDL